MINLSHFYLFMIFFTLVMITIFLLVLHKYSGTSRSHYPIYTIGWCAAVWFATFALGFGVITSLNNTRDKNFRKSQCAVQVLQKVDLSSRSGTEIKYILDNTCR